MQKKYCNMCGKEFDEWDTIQNWNIHGRAVYGSKYDLELISVDLCCDCMDKVIDSCKISPVVEEITMHRPDKR